MIRFKSGPYGVNKEEFGLLTDAVLTIVVAFAAYGLENNLHVEITSMLRSDGIHADRRAVDMSSEGWSKFHVNRVCYHLNKEFKKIAAIAPSTGKPLACYYHKVEGNEYHFHLQSLRGLK